MNTTLRKVILGSLLAGYFIADLLVAFIVRVQGSDALAGLILGMIFAQATLIAIWTAWGNVRAIVRFGTGLLLIGLVTASVAMMSFRDTSPSEAIAIGISVAVQWLAVQFPLWILRIRFQWRLAIEGARQPAGSKKDSQFGIKQMLLWMLLVAILMGITRAALPPEVLSINQVAVLETLTIVAILLVFNTLLAWPLIWGTLYSRNVLVWTPIAVVCGILITLCEVTVFNAAMPGGSANILFLLNFSQYVFVGGSLLVVRLCGYRLGHDLPDDGDDGSLPPPAEGRTPS